MPARHVRGPVHPQPDVGRLERRHRSQHLRRPLAVGSSLRQLAPPIARMVISASISCVPSGVTKRLARRASRPSATASAAAPREPSSRPSHARSNGDAFIATGNTRPVDPTNTSWPRPVAHRMTSGGPNPESARAKAGETSPYAASKWSSSLVRFRPDLPAIRNLRAGDGIWSAMTTERRPPRAPRRPSARQVRPR